MEFRLLCSPSKFTNEWKERQWKSMERVTKKCIYICRERAKEGGLTRHHPQTIKYQLGSCLPAKFISVRGASLLIIRWPISFRNEHPPMPDAIAPRKFKTAAFTVSLPRNCRLPPSPFSPASSFPPLFTCVDKN